MDHIIESALRDADVDRQLFDHVVNGSELPGDLHSRLAAGCYHVAMEHQTAIVLLIERQTFGSAFALVRPLFESLVRGMWLHYCATEEEARSILNGKNFGKLSALIGAVEVQLGALGGWLSKEAKHLDAMHGFTHTGLNQIVNRLRGDEVCSDYDYAAVLEVLTFASVVGGYAAAFVLTLSGRSDAASAISHRIRQISETCAARRAA